MEATIQGEFHTSSRDRDLLRTRIQENDAEALFQEGREDSIEPERWSVGYILFLTGAFSVFLIEDKFGDGELEVEVPKFDNIDMPLNTLYQGTSKWNILGAYLLGGGCMGLGVLGTIEMVSLFTSTPLAGDAYGVIVKFFFVIVSPLLFSFVIIANEVRSSGSRDAYMAKEIDRISSENRFEKVVVSCGNAHVEGIQQELESRGWKVTTHNSKHSRMAALYGRIIGN